jgi:uncharacterized membrane protein
VLAAGLAVADDAFNPRLFNWIGFATEKPLTEDYVPLFPWLGVALIGCWAGGLWARAGLRLSPTAARLWQALPDALRATLAKMGRWSLTIYLVHQPLLIGALGLIKRYG